MTAAICIYCNKYFHTDKWIVFGGLLMGVCDKCVDQWVEEDLEED